MDVQPPAKRRAFKFFCKIYYCNLSVYFAPDFKTSSFWLYSNHGINVVVVSILKTKDPNMFHKELKLLVRIKLETSLRLWKRPWINIKRVLMPAELIACHHQLINNSKLQGHKIGNENDKTFPTLRLKLIFMKSEICHLFRSRSPPPRRNNLQFAAPRADQPNEKGAIGFYNWQSTKMTGMFQFWN